MDSIKRIVDALQSTSKRSDKIRILEESKDNSLWLNVVKFLFDPMVVTGIASAKANKYVHDGTKSDLSLLDVLDYLRVHNTGTMDDVAVAMRFAASYPVHSAWLTQLFTKSLKLGIDVATINKVYGKNFISVFSVMLADSLSGNEEFLFGKEFILTQKLDGLRCVAIVHENGYVKFFSRTGQDYGELPDVEEDLLKLPFRGVVYDGELIAASKKASTNEVFRETSSVARRDGVKRGLVFHVFDLVPMAEFFGVGTTPCIERKVRLKDALHRESVEWVSEVKMLYCGKSLDKIPKFLDFALDKGWEGLMVNVASAPYEQKRTRNLLKVKQFKTVDVRVTGVYEGTGDFVGKLGGVTCEFDFGGIAYSTKCGSGFTVEQREKYWNNPNLVVGKIAELKYFEFSRNVDGSVSLRFPIWLDRVRFDKTETSAY